MRMQLPRFDPAAQFIAARPFRLVGRDLAPGDPVSLAGLPANRLRQLYEQRKVTPAVSPVAVATPPTEERRKKSKREVSHG